ncbi:hypothetical protein [Gemmata sp.]|uniref:hypothetical protein n=1 Tax=Gemmata sp. TaxID=1914242 RepID=UPI003F6E5265
MSGPNERDAKLIAALLACPTHEEAAAAAGTSTATLRRRLTDASFKAAYRTARRQLVEAAIGRLQSAAGQAVDALVRNLACGKPGDEIRAAVAILEHGYRGAELLDLADRLAMVEDTLKGTGT